MFEHNPWNPLTRKVVQDCPFDDGVDLISSRRIKHTAKKAFGGIGNIKIRYTIFFPRKWIFKKFCYFEKNLWWCPIGGQYYLEYEKGRL